MGWLVAAVVSWGLVSSGVRAAMSLAVSEVPGVIHEGEEFEVQVDLKGGLKNTGYFLRAAFSHPETPSSYFGATFNGSEWYSGKPAPMDHTRFLQMMTSDEGSWSGRLRARVEAGMAEKGSGNYGFKVGRYTVAGSGPSWSDNEVSVVLQLPVPSPTPTDTPTPTPTDAPAATSTPTSTPAPVPTKRPTSTPTVKKELSPTEAMEGGSLVEGAAAGEVAGVSAVAPSATAAAEKKGMKGEILPKILVGVGMGLLGVSVYPAIRTWRKGKKNAEMIEADDQ